MLRKGKGKKGRRWYSRRNGKGNTEKMTVY